MRRKLIAVFAALLVSVAANAQFEKGKIYAGASLSGLDLSYNGASNGKFAVQAHGGYLVDDNMMITGLVGLARQNGVTDFSIGAGGRYYLVQNGIYFGVSLKYVNESSVYDDLMPGVQVGYAFFLNDKITIEPELYYDHALFNFKDYSTVGFRLGLGVYF